MDYNTDRFVKHTTGYLTNSENNNPICLFLSPHQSAVSLFFTVVYSQPLAQHLHPVEYMAMGEGGKHFDWSHLYKDERTFYEPIVLEAEIVHGFQRGSKELGIPTANLSMEELGEKGESLGTGIYYGVAALAGVEYDAVVSVGWNPFYKNSKKTVEAHLLAKLEDFYGSRMSLMLYGYLRPEADFKGLDELISCINSDINIARDRLKARAKL